MPSHKEKTLRNFLLLLVVGTVGILLGCGSSGTPAGVPVPPPPGQNIQPIVVDGGPLGNYGNGAFASVKVCVPSTSTCQTIDHVLVDTGSSGLRLLQSAITISGLPSLSDGSGNVVNNCVSFLDLSYLWGPVQQADVTLAGETAKQTYFQLISSSDAPIPFSCSNGGTTNENTVQLLGANGILGVGQEPTDCTIQGFNPCDPNSGQPNPPNAYYLCPQTTGCSTSDLSVFVPITQQVTNPIVNFVSDNNGVIIDLPAVADAAATVTGSMIFGIGTQSNNALGSATVFTLQPGDVFTTTYKGQAFPGFIDSGSNGLFFQDGAISVCVPPPTGIDSFYCPPSNLSGLSALNTGANGAISTVTFGVDNTLNLFNNDPTDFAFSNLGGPLSGQFDWGLPFFYGRKVFTAIDGTTTPTGTVPPFWAY
jgi:hypothetical protein